MEMVSRYFGVVRLTHEDFLSFADHFCASFRRTAKTRHVTFAVTKYKTFTYSQEHRHEVQCKVHSSDRLSSSFALLKPGATPNLHVPRLYHGPLPVKAAKLDNMLQLRRFLTTQAQEYLSTILTTDTSGTVHDTSNSDE